MKAKVRADVVEIGAKTSVVEKVGVEGVLKVEG